MKKLLLVLAIAGFAVACNNDAENKADKKDSTATADSLKKLAQDTSAAKMDTTKMAAPDTTKK